MMATRRGRRTVPDSTDPSRMCSLVSHDDDGDGGGDVAHVSASLRDAELCPICGASVSALEFEAHYQKELARLDEIVPHGSLSLLPHTGDPSVHGRERRTSAMHARERVHQITRTYKRSAEQNGDRFGAVKKATKVPRSHRTNQGAMYHCISCDASSACWPHSCMPAYMTRADRQDHPQQPLQEKAPRHCRLSLRRRSTSISISSHTRTRAARGLLHVRRDTLRFARGH